MVSPIFIIAGALGGAFLLGLLRDPWRRASYTISLLVLTFTTTLAGTCLLYTSPSPRDL